MLTGLLVFVATLAFASAQCDIAGTIYQAENTTLYFGATVKDWVPLVHYFDDQGLPQVWFGTVRQATNTRLEVQEYGAVGFWSACTENVGQYRVVFTEDCSGMAFELISDDCYQRSVFWTSSAFTLQQREDNECGVKEGWFSETSESPVLSGEVMTSYAATLGWQVVSVSDYAAIFQQWVPSPDDDNLFLVSDYLSVPEGYACEERLIGRYRLETGPSCAAEFCGVSDSCPSRAGLWQGAKVNGYSGDECPAPITVVEWPLNGCSTGNAWTRTPQECVDQFGGNQCLFCRGVANGVDVKLCLDRNGGVCNDIFNSPSAKGWCNLEFECPASTLSLSVIAVFSVLLALLFH